MTAKVKKKHTCGFSRRVGVECNGKHKRGGSGISADALGADSTGAEQKWDIDQGVL
jgi:hypothetical protein